MGARFCTVVVVVSLLAVIPSAWSHEQVEFAKNGVYVAACGVPDFTLDGLTFEGSSGRVYKLRPRFRETASSLLITAFFTF